MIVSGSEAWAADFALLHQTLSRMNSDLIPKCVLIHGPNEKTLLAPAVKLSYTLGYGEPIIVPEHVKNCCDNNHKLELIKTALNALNSGPRCVIFPAAETALFRISAEGRALSPMVSEFSQTIERLNQRKENHLIILTSSCPWTLDSKLINFGKVENSIFISGDEHFFVLETYLEQLKEFPLLARDAAKQAAESSKKVSLTAFSHPEIEVLYEDHVNYELSRAWASAEICAEHLRRLRDSELESSETRWVAQFHLLYTLQHIKIDREVEEKRLEDLFLEFNFSDSIHDVHSYTVTSYIIQWIKRGNFLQPERVFTYATERYGLSWLLNYWPAENVKFSNEFVLDKVANPQTVSNRQVLDYHSRWIRKNNPDGLTDFAMLLVKKLVDPMAQADVRYMAIHNIVSSCWPLNFCMFCSSHISDESFYSELLEGLIKDLPLIEGEAYHERCLSYLKYAYQLSSSKAPSFLSLNVGKLPKLFEKYRKEERDFKSIRVEIEKEFEKLKLPDDSPTQ